MGFFRLHQSTSRLRVPGTRMGNTMASGLKNLQMMCLSNEHGDPLVDSYITMENDEHILFQGKDWKKIDMSYSYGQLPEGI